MCVIWIQVAGSCKHGNVPSDSIEGREFLDHLYDCWLFNDSVDL
jgi:hypothetical protein